jgi:hypothetical protein
VVQAGTMSTRHRGEPSTMNVLRVAPGRITIERQSWDDAAGSFRPSWEGAFRRSDEGWVPDQI